MPKVSVIMGVYNCEKIVEKAIASLFAQSYQDWELIICDDCSKDDTLQILQKLSAKYPQKIVVLTNETNRKLAFSLNRCLEIAQGEYIARMDADDENMPNRFEMQVAFLDSHPEYAVVASRAYIVDECGIRGIRGRSGESDPKRIYSDIPFMHPTIMMRKSTYDFLNGYTVARRTDKGQDADLWYRFTAAGFIGYTLEDPLYRYHESKNDLKRRTLKQAFYRTQNRMIGFRLNHAPAKYYIYALKPIFSALTPNFIKYRRRNKLDGEQK